MATKKLFIIVLFLSIVAAIVIFLYFFSPFFSLERTMTASSSSGAMKLTVLNGKTNLTLMGTDKSTWPKGVIGGLYKIEPSGEFAEPVIIQAVLNEDPGPFFSLGYWKTSTKSWEWVPTIKVSSTVYKAVLFHASEVGGAQNPNYSPRFNDPKNQAMANEILSILEKEMAKSQATAENILEARDKAKQLSDKLINDFCSAIKSRGALDFRGYLSKIKSNRPIINDLLSGWELTQYLGFSSLNQEFQDALDSGLSNNYEDWLSGARECRKPEKISVYTINQTDDYQTNVNLNLMQGLFAASQKGRTRVVSGGSPLSASNWKTKWKVFQNYATYSNSNQRLYKEVKSPDSYALLDVASYGTGTETHNLMALTFDLSGLKAGDTFPIKEERVSAYDSRTFLGVPPLKGVIILKEKDGYMLKWQKGNNTSTWKDSADMYSVEIIDPGITRELTGILVSDNGSAGGSIGFKKESIFTPEQLSQFKESMKGAPQELLNLYDAQGNPTFVTGDLDRKNLIITTEK